MLERMRAAVAYGETTRDVALRLKYGRKVALARTMARYMAPLTGDWAATHCSCRCRCIAGGLWWRGFNQAALVARRTGAAAGACRSTSRRCGG